MSLLWKIMLSTSVAIICLLAVAGWLVQNHFMRIAAVMLDEEVAASSRAYESLWSARAERLASVSLVLSRMSDVRAAFGTRDQTTIRDTASELWNSIAPSRTLFYVLEPGGAVVASLGSAEEIAPSFPLAAAAARFPGQATGFVIENGRLYQTVVTPVYGARAEASHRQRLRLLFARTAHRIDASRQRARGSYAPGAGPHRRFELCAVRHAAR